MRGQRLANLGDKLAHGRDRGRIDPILGHDLRCDIAGGHRLPNAPERVQHGSAELPAQEVRRRLAFELRPDRSRRQGRVEDAERAIDAFEVGAELDYALLGLA